MEGEKFSHLFLVFRPALQAKKSSKDLEEKQLLMLFNMHLLLCFQLLAGGKGRGPDGEQEDNILTGLGFTSTENKVTVHRRGEALRARGRPTLTPPVSVPSSVL